MERILIIGYGNSHRGDDGVGFRAAEQLQALVQESAVTVMATLELKPEMAETIARADMVVFLDACTEGTPGTVHVSELVPCEVEGGLFSHALTPKSLLTAAQVLYGQCPEAMLITVAGENFGFSAHLSPVVEAALPRVYERVNDILFSAKEREAVKLRSHAAVCGVS